MGKREQIEARQKLGEQAIQDVVAGRADFVKGAWRTGDGKVTPWNREAKRCWLSKNLLMMTYHADRFDGLEAEHRKAGWDLDWYRDRVCDGCTELHCDQNGKPFLDEDGNFWVKHEFHVSTAEYAEMQTKERDLRTQMEAAQATMDAFIRTITDAFGVPAALLDSLSAEQYRHAGLMLMYLEAGKLEEREGKILTPAALVAKIADMEGDIERDEAILDGREPDHGFLSREQRAQRLAGTLPGVAFLRWLLEHHADKLTA